jgi:hypothetical protein
VYLLPAASRCTTHRRIDALGVGQEFARVERLCYVLEMRLAWILLVPACLVAGRARADDSTRIDVAVGETVGRDVGIAIGFRCDDLTIARVELRTRAPMSNTLLVSGTREGITLCRVGTGLYGPTYLFELRVRPARAPR